MPDTLTEIGDSAFAYAAVLTSVELPDSVKTIGEKAFIDNYCLSTLDLGSVETIGELAFNGCGELTVTIPDTLKEVNPLTFNGTKFKLNADSAYKTIDGVLYSGDGKKLLYYPASEEKSFAIPDGVEEVCDMAFTSDSHLNTIYIPESLKTIGKEALEYNITYDYGYGFRKFKEGLRLIGKASDGVKAYAGDHNIGVFSEAPSQNITSVTLKGNETADFTINGADPDDVVFSSNDDKIASISDKGVIKGLKKGTTYVTAAIGTTYFKCEVNVKSDSGIKYTGFDDSNYLKVTPKTYKLWRQHYIKNNPKLESSFEIGCEELGIASYQSDEFYRAMNGVVARDSDNHSAGVVSYGEGYEDMIGMVNHACNTELGRYKNSDSMVLYSGAKPYASMLVAGEKNTLKNLKAAVGKKIDHAQYISTTLSPAVANNFYSGGEGVMLIIYAEKHALDNLPSGLLAAFHSDFEYEHLFATNSKLEVIDAGVRWYDGSDWDESNEQRYQRYVKLRLLGGEDTPEKLPSAKIALKSAPKSLCVKQTANLKISYSNCYDQDACYSSSNTKVAKISSSGKITALRKGTTTITVSTSEAKTSFKLTVNNPKLNKTSVTLKKGKSFTLKITGKVGSATFKSNNKKAAVVTKSGKITAKKSGKATITVK